MNKCFLLLYLANSFFLFKFKPLFEDMLPLILGREEQREKERETSIGCLLYVPIFGSNPQPRYMPCLGMEPIVFW